MSVRIRCGCSADPRQGRRAADPDRIFGFYLWYCMKFFRDTLPRLQATYIDTGKMRFIYRDYPRADRGGNRRPTAARCAGSQGRYWAMHDRLFGEGSRLDSGSFKSVAKSLGLDQGNSESASMDGIMWNQFCKISARRIVGDFMERRDLFSCRPSRGPRNRCRPSRFPERSL